MKRNPFYLGVAYYPEMWDRATIDFDIKKMKELGINSVRIAEFAWSTMEPMEGKFDFSLFSYVMDKMEEAGIHVVLCTPTATPPKWLTDKYPESVRTLDSGKQLQFGARGHACKSSKVYREKTRMIVEQMCKALAHKKALIGWQIDNEIFPYDDGCFCDQCLAKFRSWLKAKYGTIDNLNTSWGTCRWSLTYRDFDDVIAPRKDIWNHPSLEADWLSFQSDNIIDYVHFQKDIIAQYSDAPIGTDMMYYAELDHDKMNEKLDIVQFNHYEKEGELWYAAFWFDYMRTIKDRPFWCTETQANWIGAFCAQWGPRAAENCYANTMLPFLKGGEMNMTWLWRTHPCGQEIWHGALLDPAGREYYTTPQFKRVSNDLQKSYEALANSKILSDIAIHFSANAAIQLKYAKVVDDFEYVPAMRQLYRSFLHHNVDVIGLNHDLSGYKVLISPFVTYIDDTTKEKILSWVEQGGRWIVGPMSDIYDGALRRYTHSPFGFVEEAAHTYCKYNVPIHHEDYQAVWTDGTPVTGSRYFDGYEDDKANHLATYTEGDLKGLGMITEKSYGKGTIVLVGSFLDSRDLVRLTNREPIAAATDNMMLNRKTTASGKELIICMELFNKPGKIELEGTYEDLITGMQHTGEVWLKPYQAAIFMKTE